MLRDEDKKIFNSKYWANFDGSLVLSGKTLRTNGMLIPHADRKMEYDYRSLQFEVREVK